MLQQDAHHTLHAVCLHGLAGEVQQVLQGVGGRAGLAQVDVQGRRFAGLAEAELLGGGFFMGVLL